MDYEEAEQRVIGMLAVVERHYGTVVFHLMKPSVIAYFRAMHDVQWPTEDLLVAACDLAYQELQCQKK